MDAAPHPTAPPPTRASLRRRVLVASLGVAMFVVPVVGIAAARWAISRADDGEVYGWPSFVLAGVVGHEFDRAYESAVRSGDPARAWERAVAVLDARSTTAEAGERIRFGRDDDARIAVLYTSSGPVAQFYADGDTAKLWSRELVARIADAPGELAWTRELDDLH